MQETATPALAESRTNGHLGDLPPRNARQAPGRAAFAVRGAGAWSTVTTTEFADAVAALAKGFVAAGVGAGQRVAIMSKTRYEWTLTDFALWTCGAVPVPIYETSSDEQVAWILEDSGAVGIVTETGKHRDAVAGVATRLPELRSTWCIDDGDLDTLAAGGAGIGDEALAASTADTDRSSVATIIYTSGTTGRPKGVELTHGNFLDLAENASAKLAEVVQAEEASTLLFLPLAHVFARFIEVLCVEARVTMGHSATISTLLDDFAAFRPTFILAVPRVFEKIYNSAEAKAAAGGKGAIFARAAATAQEWSQAQDTGRVSLGLRVRHAVFDRLVYSTLRQAMGGRIRYAVSGGAPLGTRLGHFYRGIGVTVLEGYGLTETTAPVAVNIPGRVRIGTVGPPLPGSAVRIAEDGEILLQGVGVFGGYHANDTATREAFEDGWFRTGDLGELDEQGCLRITGRKKEILVTAGGKNVAPAVLEDRLRAHPLISQCIVVGDQKPFIGALITLDAEMLPTWAANHRLEGLTLAKAVTNETVRAEIQRAVDDANSAVSRAEAIRKFAILDTDFTEESGHLTPSLKLKRNLVMRDFADDVDELYAG